jgi:hypothetical protein
MQGILPKDYDVTRPIQGPDWQETLDWYRTLPQIGRLSHAVDLWRELDAMQLIVGEQDEND